MRRIVIVFAFAVGLWLFALAADRMHADAAPAAQPPTSSTGAHSTSGPPSAARTLRAQVPPIVGRVVGRAVPVRLEQKPAAGPDAVGTVVAPVVGIVRTALRDGGHTIETTVAPVRHLVERPVGRAPATPVAVPILRPSQPNALGPVPLPASTIRRAPRAVATTARPAASAALRAKAPSTAAPSAAARGSETAATARAVSRAGGSDPSLAGAPDALRASSGRRPTRNPEPPVRPDQPPAVSAGSTTSATARPAGADGPGAVITSTFGLPPAAYRAYRVSWARAAGSGPALLPGFSPD